MPRYALLINNAFTGRLEMLPAQPVDIAHKNIKWRPCPAVAQPVYDAKTQKISGPTYTVAGDQSSVTEVWTVDSLTAQEISDAKDAAVNGINGTTWAAPLQAITQLENEIRDLRSKVNAEVVAAGRPAPYTAGQTSPVTVNQVKTAIKNGLS